MRDTAQTMRYLSDRIGTGDHAAFRCLYRMRASATLVTIQRDLPDPVHSTHILTGTFCEVWWTCSFDARYGGPSRDIAPWIDGIAKQRASERVRLLASLASVDPMIEFIDVDDCWAQFQLAELLDERIVVPPPRPVRTERRRRGIPRNAIWRSGPKR